jgi:amino acid transporter
LGPEGFAAWLRDSPAVGVTDTAGAYRFPSLVPGTYTVKMELSGFQSLVREGIVVLVGQTTPIDATLKVATLAETVVLLLLIVFLSVNVSVLVLRRDRVEHDHFRIWTVIPVLGIGSCILLLTQQRPAVWLFGGILLAVGGVLYLLARWGRNRAAARTGSPSATTDTRTTTEENHDNH